MRRNGRPEAVRIIVPFPAGGSADLLPRYVGEKLSQQWGQPVIVDNRPGAAGNIGATAAYQAEPDGYTLLSAPPPPLVINRLLYPKLAYDSTQFVPMTRDRRDPERAAGESEGHRGLGGGVHRAGRRAIPGS